MLASFRDFTKNKVPCDSSGNLSFLKPVELVRMLSVYIKGSEVSVLTSDLEVLLLDCDRCVNCCVGNS